MPIAPSYYVAAKIVAHALRNFDPLLLLLRNLAFQRQIPGFCRIYGGGEKFTATSRAAELSGFHD